MADGKYRAFAAAAETGSLTRAAEMLGYTQSGVSHLVDALEDELHLKLLTRQRTGTVLTEEGRMMLPYVQAVLRALEALAGAAGELRGLQSGSIRIGTVSSVALQWLPAILSRYMGRYPGIEVHVKNGSYDQVEQALAESRLDCAFITMPSHEDFAACLLSEDQLMAVLPKAHPLAREKSIEAEALADMPFIIPAEGSNYDIGKLFRRMSHKPHISFDMGDDYAALAMVRRGIGATVLPELLLKNMPADGIAAVPIRDTTRHIGLATRANANISPALGAFIECTREYLAGGER